MKVLIIANESPYGGERTFNACRLAVALQTRCDGATVRLFLLGDAVTAVLPNQLRPEGAFNVEDLMAQIVAAGGEIKACSTCADHRGLFALKLSPGVCLSSMPELAAWVEEADKVVTF